MATIAEARQASAVGTSGYLKRDRRNFEVNWVEYQ
jgi:hypothetical protein